MSKPSHTPGPWIATPEDNGEWGIYSANWGIATVAACAGMEAPNGRSDANARLIAAAPTMAPLVEVLASLPIGPNTADDVPLYGLDGVYITHGHVRAARAALAKARGEA